MADTWDDIADWWVDVVRHDPAQSSDTHDVLHDLVTGTAGAIRLDLGCGEGQGMRFLAGQLDGHAALQAVIGVDMSSKLLDHARSAGQVVRARLPDLSWVRARTVDLVTSVGLLDLIEDHQLFFAETARVVRPDGYLIIVVNHPVATSPDSAPFADPGGEILWRWGSYLEQGSFAHDADGRVVDSFHRPMGDLLTAAARSGWSLERLIERGPNVKNFADPPGLHGFEQLPTVAGLRWIRRT